MELLAQGAEGKVFLTTFLGKPAVCKVRLVKRYRASELDEKLNRQRLLQEARCIAKCKRLGISVPCIYFVDIPQNSLYLEKISGMPLKQLLLEDAIKCKFPFQDIETPMVIESAPMQENFEKVAHCVGLAIAHMHDAEIVHGDLTTSNILLKANTADPQRVVLIDFGLGAMRPTAEDKAVDLYVLERAFVSTHPGTEVMVERIFEHYRFHSKKGTSVLLKLDQVRQRGRKRDMIG